jgi:hypothetical protein
MFVVVGLIVKTSDLKGFNEDERSLIYWTFAFQYFLRVAQPLAMTLNTY